MDDKYKTIKASSTGIFKDRGSKFIAIAHPVECIEDVKNIQEIVKKEYRDARHHCYAYRIGTGDDNWRVNDDGEPSGTAGKPIFGQIQSFELSNILIIVVRYFGGTLLGVGGLINAYRNAAREALINSEIIEKTVNVILSISFPYEKMNDVMKLIKDEKLIQSNQIFDLSCSLDIQLRASIEERILSSLQKIENISVSKNDPNSDSSTTNYE